MISVAHEPTAAQPRPAVRHSGSLGARIHAALAAWRRRARERAQLAHLSERELRDIGLTPGEAEREYAKPFWRD